MFNVVENTEMLQGVCSVSIQSTVCGLVHLKKKKKKKANFKLLG